MLPELSLPGRKQAMGQSTMGVQTLSLVRYNPFLENVTLHYILWQPQLLVNGHNYGMQIVSVTSLASHMCVALL